ncbi:lipopolysaccharide biosynthesis protein [Aquirufa echingensis]|uniref:Polysaccharide biosynthesis C-terminal domain-containing protein n=1 Tax=Aquirufa echingensis TaxID=3096516 RepID=A0ABW6D603_9BACT
MGIVIRQSLKASIVTYLGTAIGTFNVIFLYNQFLNQDEVGLIAGALVSIPLIFASFTQLGIPQLAVRFFPHFDDPENGHNGFFTFLLISPLVGLSLFTLGYIGLRETFHSIYADTSPLLPRYFYYIIPLTCSFLYMAILEAYARVHLRIVVPAIIREILLRLSNSALILGFGLGYLNLDQLVLGITLSYVFAVIGLLIYIKQLKRFYTRLDFSFLRKPVFNEMLQYGGWVILAGASFTLIQHVEKIMLPAYAGGLGTTAVFDINSRMALMIAIPRNVIAAISTPILAQAWKRNDHAQIADIYKKSSANLLLVGCFLFLGIWCNLDFIYQIIPNHEAYEAGKWVVLLVGISKVIDMGTGLNSEILINSKYYRYDLIFYLILAIGIVIGNLIFIPLYSYNGAALASLIALGGYNAIKYFFLWNKMGMQPFDMKTLGIILSSLIIAYVVLAIPVFSDHWFLNVGIRSSAVTVLFFLACWGFNLSPDIRQMIENKLKK